MICVLGEVSIKGKVAYLGQRPFIQNSTLKDNILFGQPYDEIKYQKTLEVYHYYYFIILFIILLFQIFSIIFIFRCVHYFLI